MAQMTAIPEYLEGHADFAAYISIDPDLQIYRRFARLAARNILHLQSELATLEAWLDDFDREEADELWRASQDEKMNIWLRNRNWATFVGLAHAGGNQNSSASDEEKRQAAKLQKVERLKVVMAEYQDALLRQNRCGSLPAPDKSPLKAFSDWYSRKNPLLGPDSKMLDNADDLVCLRNPGETDRLSRVLRANAGMWLGYFHEKSNRYPASWGRIWTFREKHVERLIAIASVALAALFLVGAMISLSYASSDGFRLGLVGAFTLSFAASVGLLTSAKRTELFASTAAYAAVLVVYVSGSTGLTTSCSCSG
ncbi:hypothetical protein B0H66DRAFT_606649 [Apodospora peruviana]|uniref:DUF6594 domain-containing protein n=1 Tax=Apodospora peruviana TaxID=516989 RepID=A0AAE0LZJ3_9PEZI|nr:hypothetical protein B0H66DRAFT_606649 [Apodospora peruviana]